MIITNNITRISETKKIPKKINLGIISLLIVFMIAFLMRMLSYASLTADGGITFTGYDEFYHMRRILYTTFNFPSFLNFDTYINYPYGFEVGWPPFFDLLGALLAIILGAGQPDVHTVEFAGAILPVLLGVLTIIPVYVIAASIFNRKTGVVGALVFAVLPAHVYISRFGTVDHHVAEVFLSTVAYAFFILALKQAGESKLSSGSLKNISSDKKPVKPLVYSAVSGLFFSLLIFTWVGAPAFVSFIVLYALIQATLDLKTGRKSDYLFICSAVALLATLLFTIPLSAGAVREGLEMSAMYLSWFQVVYLVIMLAGILLLWGFSSYASKKEMDWKYYPGILILVFGSGLLFLRIFSGEYYAFIIEGMRFFSGKGEYISTIVEAVPLFLTGQGKFTLSGVLGSFGLTFLTALAGLFLLILELKSEKSRPENIFFLVWTLFYAYLALSQRRFTYLFALNVSILTAYLFWVLMESLDFENEIKKLIKRGKGERRVSETAIQTEKKSSLKRKSKNRQVTESKIKTEEPDYFKLVSGTALIALIFVSSIWIDVTYAKDGVSIDPGWQDSLEWLEASTPETSYYLEPSETPEYGVLSWWDYGNWIVYVGKRPAVSNNFQTGVEDSANFLLTDSEEEAKTIVEKLKVKYVMTDTLMAEGKFSSITSLAGKEIGEYYEVETVKGDTGLRTVATPKQALLQTQVYKLHKLDGTSLGHFRLVHESAVNSTDDGNSKENTVKVFEYVKGATLSGTASPNETLMATLELSSNTGRKFTYQRGDVADENGLFEITIPYSTESTGDGVHATSAYSLTSGEKPITSGIQVTEDDILNGNRIEVKAPEGA
ncbi:oligosaccharyl transferase, archaeosortase A system-associated [Methanosarcina mazei]|uniref:dolichyl-phosphooligosaccharide-protein glycotransferase n=1 Tax=Methanosarcina mazei TaxID=2209 RepID=A0A0F8G2Z5_METMZ|nr:oligosaccharyl transferase, archaeosortase A system-associated [Methanosarcina mazei]KKG51595.1 peptide transporter [Methanosarcina mazei]KKG59687.1 peptide transporter [Methanosarcina mazei]KKG59999.1 peptide transporter [Methanosarcina mazei]KKG91667.1 peptide transporter [Methanosarcina mazei]KKG92406.1 peptide transporter [Methanosarcina mazei]